MTQPTKKQISDFDPDDGPADLRLATVAKYMIRKNGLGGGFFSVKMLEKSSAG